MTVVFVTGWTCMSCRAQWTGSDTPPPKTCCDTPVPFRLGFRHPDLPASEGDR